MRPRPHEVMGGNMSQQLFIVWQEGNDTGVTLLDEQHRGIVSIINTLHYALSMGKGNNKLYSQIIDTICSYSSIHFTTEEGMMEACKYIGLENHKITHHKLLRDTKSIQYDVIKANDPKPLLEFLKKWWIEHINSEDRLYTPYLRASRDIHS